MQEETSLAELRAQIDAVDDAMHDLLMKRAALVEQVGRVKSAQDDSGAKGVLRPKREIEIMRRLWNRHKGALDKEVVMRVWREIISACVNLQFPVTLAAFMPERGAGLSEIARGYFGSFTPVMPCCSVNLVLKELTQGEADAALLPLYEDKQACWWYAVAQEYKRNVSVFLKLPFEGSGICNRGAGTAYALAKMPYEPTGDDRTLLVAETDGTISLSTLDLILKSNGIATNTICDTYNPDMMRKAYLFEVDGWLSDRDDRLGAIVDKENGKITTLRVIGGYPAKL